MPEMKNEICEGCTVVIQKGAYLKTCCIVRGRNYIFGKRGDSQFTLNLDGAIGCVFGSQFRMELIKKRVFSVQKIEDHAGSLDIVKEGGEDNRALKDDGLSQKLTPEEIIELKHKGLSGKEVIQKITENSTTFKEKTVYSQEKYINKKKKKYGENITIHRPSVRLLSDMFYTQDPVKIANLRLDSLSQILCHSNVQPGGKFAVFESATQGLVTAAMLHRMGTTGHLVQIYHGTQPQRHAVDLMNFSQEEMEVLSFINHTKLSGIRQTENDNTEHIKISGNVTKLIKKVEAEDIESGGTEETEADSVAAEEEVQEAKQHNTPRPRKFVRSLVEDVKLSSAVLASGVDGLVVACRQYPNTITKELLHFLRPGFPFVIFSPFKEPLMELYPQVKGLGGTNLRLSETWLRHYQVLPQRTHPEINMSGGGGYLLYGTLILKGQE